MSIQPIRKVAQNHRGKLLGWLVSYALDEKGKTYELRSGRTFISSTELGGIPTLSLNLEGIDPAHLVVSATTEAGLRVQDLFSPHGAFVTKAGVADEQKISGIATLNHGDWIRIGTSLRFQICLIGS